MTSKSRRKASGDVKARLSVYARARDAVRHGSASSSHSPSENRNRNLGRRKKYFATSRRFRSSAPLARMSDTPPCKSRLGALPNRHSLGAPLAPHGAFRTDPLQQYGRGLVVRVLVDQLALEGPFENGPPEAITARS